MQTWKNPQIAQITQMMRKSARICEICGLSLLVLWMTAAQSVMAQAPSFARDILPIFEKYCLTCHVEPVKAGGLLLGSYEQLMAGSKSRPVVLPGKGNDSLIVKMLDGRGQPMMPQGGPQLDARSIALIRAWIDAGAKGPAPGEVATARAPEIPDIKPRVPVNSQVGALAFRADGSLLAVGRYRQVQLIEPASRRVLATLDGHADVVRALAFSPDGRLLAVGGGLPARKGQLKVWDVEARRELRTIEGHADSVYALAFSRDGKQLASASYDKLVKLWNPDTGAEIRTLKDHTDAIFALAYSPDGKRLATGAADRTVKIWDPATGQRLFTLSDALDAVYAVAWHPSGKQIAAGGADKTLRMWDVTFTEPAGGKLTQSITGHEDAILQVAYTLDGKALVTASADRSLKIWDPQTLVERQVLERQADWVMALVFSPDGKWLAAGRYDGSVSFYDSAGFQETVVLPVRASM